MILILRLAVALVLTASIVAWIIAKLDLESFAAVGLTVVATFIAIDVGAPEISVFRPRPWRRGSAGH